MRIFLVLIIAFSSFAHSKYCTQRIDGPCLESAPGQPGKTLIVLQGELGFSKSEKGVEYQFIKSSTPDTCTVVTLYNKEYKVALVSHIDDYTSVTDFFNSAEKILNDRFNLSLSKDSFEGHILGGRSNAKASSFYSMEKNELAYQTLMKYSNIKVERHKLDAGEKNKPDTNNRPQILLEVANGAVTLIYSPFKDKSLEKFQIREYGRFNDFLDILYPNVRGIDLPDFNIKEATRLESMLTSDANFSPQRVASMERDQYPPVSSTVTPQSYSIATLVEDVFLAGTTAAIVYFTWKCCFSKNGNRRR